MTDEIKVRASVYSPSQHTIYPGALYDLYEAAGSWPEDGVEISDEDAIKFNGVNQPDGMMLDMVDGKLTWVPRPIPDETIIQQNTSKKSALMAEASEKISILTDATDPDIIGDDINPEDVTNLKLWKAYRVQLSRVTDMLNPVWPKQPNA